MASRAWWELSFAKEILESADVTDEILRAAENIHDGWYPEGRIDWDDFINRLDGTELDDGSKIDLGDRMDSSAIRKIKKHVRAYRKLDA